MRKQTIQELRARLDEGEETIVEDLYLEMDIREAELYILGIERWYCLCSGPSVDIGSTIWWLPWAECG